MDSNILLNAKLFSLSGLILGFTSTFLLLILVIYGKAKFHKIWALFNLSVAWWGFGSFFMGLSENPSRTLFITKIAYLGVLFIPVFFYHFSCIFSETNRRFLITFAYLQVIFFSVLSLSSNGIPFISHVERIGTSSMYYIRSTGVLYNVSFAIWIALVSMGFSETLLRYFREPIGIKRNQLLYLFVGFFLGFTGGLSNFLPVYGIEVVPLGNFTIPFYCIVSTYAILKYKLLHIKIIITRVGAFIVVYSLLLGIPFWLGIKYLGLGSWIIPTSICAVLATACPFIFLYIQRRAEKNLLQEEQRIQDLLIQASYGMNTIRNLQRLLELIIEVVGKTLKVNKGEIYLLNKEGTQYSLAAPQAENPNILDSTSSLIQILREKNFPVVYDEIKILSDMENNNDRSLKEIQKQIIDLSANVVVPITLNSSLIGFLTLGERNSKEMYSRGLLNALSVLGNQAALAIENCNYLAAETKRLEAEGLKERIVSLDHMASSLAHEIDNPMHSVHTTIGYVRNFLLTDARVRYLPEELKQEFESAMARIQMAGERVSGMVKAILDYSKMGKGELKPVIIQEAVEGFKLLKLHQLKSEGVHLDLQVENNLPLILGDRIQLEEIFMNFVNNSMHAVRHREEKLITLKIFKKDSRTVRIECIDNGYGIEKNFLNDMFLSSTTTKGSSEGTGLGLFRVRKIVDAFGGKVWGESEGKDKGATLIVELPVYDGDKVAGIDTLKPDKENEGKKKKEKDDGQIKN